MHFRFVPLLLAVLLASAGCRDAKVTSYRVPKEKPDPLPPILTGDAPMSGAGGADMASTAVPTASGNDLTWDAPATWKAQPLSAMRKGSFTVTGSDGAAADLSITAFPGDVGGLLANVNRWRGQVQLPPIGDSELATATTQLESRGLTFVVVDVANSPSPKTDRILGAIVPFEGATWFFKLKGPDALVEQQKSAFMTFLQTVKPAAPERATR
ncbi:MAG TPA: hypothetical protein VG710_02435 [Opitutus sp.]|nr:hypothetical protein [Opitutus sp.]